MKLQVVAGIESAVDVAAGGMHTAVLDSNGKVALLKWDFSPVNELGFQVWTFGCNDEGSLGRTIEEEEESFLPGEVLIIFVIMKRAYCQIAKLR